eukprot:CAMPEP_0185754690 /NCGR_PEP_ID=MMETSP1174-20130828/13297_1 /TAXON_ID=35687 /ORGANISM="Dictyocha speculum, Strain CCMP1381" /LENGTH=81 /DNA_ID=CAMNT_0028432999 /DNA_START=57 /DNA_END=299 /DNA_ORIENTATION=+
MPRVPVDPWPFTYFTTRPLFLHTQEFNPIGATLLHLPLLDEDVEAHLRGTGKAASPSTPSSTPSSPSPSSPSSPSSSPSSS